jgi:hypothetical protein
MKQLETGLQAFATERRQGGSALEDDHVRVPQVDGPAIVSQPTYPHAAWETWRAARLFDGISTGFLLDIPSTRR